MELLITLLIVLVVVLSVAIAWMISRPKAGSQEPKGVLNVVYDDAAGGPGLYLALTVPIEDVVSQKRVVFNVNVIRKNSQK